MDFTKAQEARDAGIERSASRANRQESEWTGMAMGHLTAFAAMIGRPFIVEEARAWAYERGLPLPTDDRAWGAVTRRADRKGLIRRVEGTARARSSNLSPKPLWESAR